MLLLDYIHPRNDDFPGMKIFTLTHFHLINVLHIMCRNQTYIWAIDIVNDSSGI